MKQDAANRERTTDLGVVRISNDAIASIASTAAMEVRGVSRMGGGITRMLYDSLLRKKPSKGVRIQMKDSEVKLTVSVIVDYGVDIPGIADEVQESVKRAVEKMTGLVLAEVNVVVEGVRAPGLPEKERKI